MDDKNTIIYLNKPISSDAQDVIEVSTYVEKLDAAIDKDAQMIGIISPFGAGKSSVVHLLQKKRPTKDKFVKVSMWSQCSKTEKDSNTFHKSFLYQIAEQIDPHTGSYISKRLSKNYGFLKLSLKNKNAITLAILWALLLIVVTGINSACVLFPNITNYAEIIKVYSLVLSFAVGIILFIKSDIVFSSNKSEGTRDIEDDEIMDLYRTVVLNHNKRNKLENIFNKITDLYRRIVSKSDKLVNISDKITALCRRVVSKFNKRNKFINVLIALKNKIVLKTSHEQGKLIIVIEDLDRSDNPDIVINFLKEIRKYYIPDNLAETYKNKVVFIVTVMPEALIRKEEKPKIQKPSAENPNDESYVNNFNISRTKNESLFAKLFDYTLNLQTINIDNYEAILSGILNENEKEWRKLNIVREDVPLINIPGMLWIIRERKLGIREIKERLNIALTTYESLTKKFGESRTIEFEKCAVAAYITTAFEEDFYKTGDRVFEKLIDRHLKHNDDGIYNQLITYMSKEYVDTIVSLVESKLIDSSYRTYFYNFPKNSHLYTLDETQISNALLYNENVSELETIAQNVENCNSKVIDESILKLIDLKLILPKSVFESETIYKKVVKINFDKVIEYISRLDYSDNSILQTIAFIKQFLSLDSGREILGPIHIHKLCDFWCKNLNESTILKIRKMLAHSFSHEIGFYKLLFMDNHKIITDEEIKLIEFNKAIDLTNIDNNDFSTRNIENLMQRFIDLPKVEIENSKTLFKDFLDKATSTLGNAKISPYLLKYMQVTNTIIDTFERAVVQTIINNSNHEENENE